MKKTAALLNRLVEEIEKTPLIQIACDKVGISRNTFYRWMKEDEEFLTRVNEAVSLGTGLVSDVAISNVLEGIKKKDAMYTKYWLSHKHPDFRRPFVHRVEADDLLVHSRILAEGARKHRIEQEIKNTGRYIDEEAALRDQQKVDDFMKKWQDNIDKGDEQRAQILFEKWKQEYESKVPVPVRPDNKKVRKKSWR
jgi:hypothetical protein